MNSNINGDIKSRFCPNTIINDNNISVGEFKTIQDACAFPLNGIWCINRDNDNKFNAYQSQGTRMFVVCSWGRNDNDSLKYILALIHTNGKIQYWDMNDLPLYPESKRNQYEGSLGDNVTHALYQIAQNMIKKDENIKKEQYMKNTIRLTENQLHRVIKESVNKILKEQNNPQIKPYFDKLNNANSDLCDIMYDCPDISQEIRERIYDAVTILNDCKLMFIKEKYVSPLDDPFYETNVKDDDEYYNF